MTVQIHARENHYVPRAQLRRWSTDGRTVWAYRLLVSHSSVPEWRRMSVRSLASQRDLYSIASRDGELDEFERWIAGEYEQPANRAVDKVTSGARLRRDDWQSLARFVALQDVRTPLGFHNMMRQLERDLPAVMNQTMRDGLEEFQRRGRRAAKPSVIPDEYAELSKLIKVTVHEPPNSETKEASLRAEMVLGRQSWIAYMRYLLQGRAAAALCDHKWSIVEAPEEIEWPLTDHPVLKLNYYGPGRYDFRGGWGRRGGNIFMPITPRHLLFVQIGEDSGRKLTVSRETSLLFRSLLLERAHRWVFATRPMDWVSQQRPRRVDPEAFRSEREMWERWHEDQSAAETSQA